MTDSSVLNALSEGVEGLADAVVAAVGRDGPLGALVSPLVDALKNVWEDFVGSPTPASGTNWNAYTHEQLHKMLWHDADVGDVSAVAAEWGRQGSELTAHADSLRKEQASLQSHWSGDAAKLAADQLGQLSDRTAGIGVRATAVQRAAQDAGDALALARNTMPPPAGDPMAMLAPPAGGPTMGFTIGAVVGGSDSMFTNDMNGAGAKAQAVRVMEKFESSLTHSSHTIAPAGSTEARTYQTDGVSASGSVTSAAGFGAAPPLTGGGDAASRGVPWTRLVGGDPLAPESGTGANPQLRSALATRSVLASEMLAARQSGGFGNGMFPGAGTSARGEDDHEHNTRLPTVDQHLFTVDERTSKPVIGQ